MILSLALRNLSRNPRRTFMVLASVALGAAGLFGFHGLNAGMLEQYKKNTIRAKYGHGQLFAAGFRGKAHEKPWDFWISDAASVTESLRRIPGVKYVFPRLNFAAVLATDARRVNGWGTGVEGASEARFFDRLNIIQGRAFENDPSGILLGTGLARALHVGVGDRLTVSVQTIHGSANAADFVVSGIFEIGLKDYDDTAFRIEFAQAQSLLDTDRAESLGLGLERDEDWNVVAAHAVADHPQLEAVSFDVLDQIVYGNSVAWLGAQFSVFQAIILIIVLLGIFNSVAVTVLERKEEFGFLRANGESRRLIFALLIVEALLLGAAGCGLGLAAMWALNALALRGGLEMPAAPGFTLPFRFWLELEPRQALKVLALGSSTSLIAAALAGAKALRLSIGESLRS